MSRLWVARLHGRNVTHVNHALLTLVLESGGLLYLLHRLVSSVVTRNIEAGFACLCGHTGSDWSNCPI